MNHSDTPDTMPTIIKGGQYNEPSYYIYNTADPITTDNIENIYREQSRHAIKLKEYEITKHDAAADMVQLYRHDIKPDGTTKQQWMGKYKIVKQAEKIVGLQHVQSGKK